MGGRWTVVLAGLLTGCGCDPASEICVGDADEPVVDATDADGDGHDAGDDDCDDHDASAYAGAPELCDGVDNDCDPATGEDGRATLFPYRGRALDVTAALAAGDAAAPAAYTLDRPGALTLCPGTWYATIRVEALTADVVGRGAGVALDAGGAGVAIDATVALPDDVAGDPGARRALNVRRLTVRGGSGVEGGGVAIDGGDLTLSRVDLVGNAASAAGGGVFVRGGSLTIDGGSVRDNVAPKGGGVFVEAPTGGRAVAVRGAEVSGNRASTAGAGLHLEVGSWQLQDVTLADNTATGPGGGLAALGAGVGLVGAGCDVRGNSATGGGGLYLDGGEVQVEAPLSGNQAAGFGGGVSAVDGADVQIEADVTGNTSELGGGALYAVGASLTVGGVSLLGNRSTSGAGAVELGTQATLTMNGGVISLNQGARGGGVAAIGGRVTLTGTTLQSNDASDDGGGLYFDGFGVPPSELSLVLQGVTITSNTAAGDGGGLWAQSATLQWFEGSAEQNTADAGGGAWLADVTASLATLHVDNNLADGDGGGLAVYDSELTLADVNVGADSSATGNGGGMLLQAATVSASATRVSGGSAMFGGGVYQVGGQLTWLGGGVDDSTSRVDGGGLHIGTGTACFADATFAADGAARAGGGVLVAAGASVHLEGCAFTDNVPHDVYAGSSFPVATDPPVLCTPSGCAYTTATDCLTP